MRRGDKKRENIINQENVSNVLSFNSYKEYRLYFFQQNSLFERLIT
jgi:hypothetical protein